MNPQVHIPDMPIVILSKPLDPASNTLHMQNYNMNGELVIPLFSSKEAFEQSTQGQVENPKVAIKLSLLQATLRGDEVFMLDPGLSGQRRITAEELKSVSTEL